MIIQDELNKLYDEHTKSRFVRCGIVDEETYNKSRTKVLWLLKDPNDPKEQYRNNDWKPWNLPEQIRINIKEKKWKGRQMWKVVGAMTYGLQQENFPSFLESYDNYESKAPNICKGLKAIAVTNLKKIEGGGSSKQDEIIISAKDDKDLWSEEIRIMAPDLVVCGGTYNFIKGLLKLSKQNIQAGSEYATHYFGGHKCLLLSMYHPAYHISPTLHYAFFKDCIEELRNEKRLP